MVNRNHPDFPEYERKYAALWEKYDRRMEEVEPKRWEWRGRDDPYTPGIMRELNAGIKALQKEYKHLFE